MPGLASNEMTPGLTIIVFVRANRGPRKSRLRRQPFTLWGMARPLVPLRESAGPIQPRPVVSNTHLLCCRAPTNCCLRPSTHRAILRNQTGHRESHKPPILPLSTITHLPCTGTNHNLASQVGPNLGNVFAHALNKIYKPGIAEPGIADPAPLGLAPPRLASLCPASLTWQKEPSDGRQVHAAGQPPTCLNKLQSCSGDAKPENFAQRAFIGQRQ